MNNYGLTPEQLALLQAVFAHYAEIEQVKLYGSRAKGNFQAYNDIDLAAFGEKLNRFIIGRVLLELEESDLPYLVDLHNYHELQNLALIEHINRAWVVIYNKNYH